MIKRTVSLVAPAIALAFLVMSGSFGGNVTAAPREIPLSPTGTLEAGDAVSATWDQLKAAEATTAPVTAPADLQTALPKDPVAYAAAKAAANAAPQTSRPAGAASRRSALHADGAEEDALAPPGTSGINFNAHSQACCLRPPDAAGAIGLDYFVQTTNSNISIWDKSNSGIPLSSMSLNTFLGGAYFLFDPRIIYDPVWNRYVMLATTRTVSTTDTLDRLKVAISTSSNPFGGWWIYTFDAHGGAGNWLDYPMLGANQDAILFTGNVFHWTGPSSDSYVTTEMFAVAKARLYNGWGFGVPLWTGLAFTLAPPVFSEFADNDRTYFMSTGGPANTISQYVGTRMANPGQQTLAFLGNMGGVFTSVPPNADQPGTATNLDTLDGRIQQNIVQYGETVWVTYARNASGFPTPQYYQINMAGGGLGAVVRGDLFYVAFVSNDWNPSIAVNASGDAFLTWSSTDPTAGAAGYPRVMANGLQTGDPGGDIVGGINLKTSPSFYTGGGLPVEHWGDYSQVTLDPKGGTCPAFKRAWITNEKARTTSTWGTQIARITFCP